MNLKKIALGVIAFIALLILGYSIQQNNSNTSKICAPVANEMVCQECSCPRGKPIPGFGSAACPDGATPICKHVEN